MDTSATSEMSLIEKLMNETSVPPTLGHLWNYVDGVTLWEAF